MEKKISFSEILKKYKKQTNVLNCVTNEEKYSIILLT